jgi:hypothetical protein
MQPQKAHWVQNVSTATRSCFISPQGELFNPIETGFGVASTHDATVTVIAEITIVVASKLYSSRTLPRQQSVFAKASGMMKRAGERAPSPAPFP